MAKKTKDYKIALFGSLLILLIINLVWFNNFNFSVFMGDDLNAWRIFTENNGFVNYAFQTAAADKYRPVYNIVQFLLFESLGPNYAAYKYINLLMNYIIAVTIFFVLYSMIKGKSKFGFLFPLLIAILYITSRFSYYNVLQTFGLMEALCLFFLVLIIGCLLQYDKSKREKYLILVCILNFLIVFTHERYMVMFPALVIIFCFFSLERSKKLLYSFLLIFPTILNYLIKKFFFASTFLEGTGGAAIDFNIKQIFDFFISGVLNIFGFNIGPSYLSGLDFIESTKYAQFLSFIILVALVILMFFSIRQSKFNQKYIVVFVVSLALIGSLLLVSSITIRQEFRWLYAPYTLFLIFILHLLKDIWYTKKVAIVFMIFVTASLISNIYYKNFQYNVFFVSAQIIAESAHDEILVKNGEELREKTLYIEKNDTALDWTLLDSLFFQVYTDKADFKVNYFSNINEINILQKNINNTLIYRFDSGAKEFVDISQELLSSNLKKTSITINPENWSMPDSNYPSTTTKGEKLYYRLVDINALGAELIRMDTNQPYVLSKTVQNNETVAELQPNEYAMYKANNDYYFLWISASDNILWSSSMLYYTRE